MSIIKKKIDSYFYKLAEFFYDHRLKTIFSCLIFLCFLFQFLPDIVIDTSTEGFFFKDDTPMVEYNSFRDQFGRDEIVIVAIKPENIFSLDYLKKLKQIHNDFEQNVPYLNNIKSLVNIRSTEVKKDDLIIDDLEKRWPKTNEGMAKFKNLVCDNPFYENYIISNDGKINTIILESNEYSSNDTEDDLSVLDGFDNNPLNIEKKASYLTEQENSEFVTAIEEIVSKYRKTGLEIFVAGTPLFNHYITTVISSQTALFLKLSLLLLVIVLYILFRRISGVILPLLIVIISLISSISLMAALKVPITLCTQILPAFLIIVGVGDSVHILAVFYYIYNNNGDKKKAILYSVKHSGLAILLTSITTAGGLLSFSFAKISPIADLGIFGAIGVIIAFIFTITLIPSIVSLFPIKNKKPVKILKKQIGLFDKILVIICKISTRRPAVVLVIFLIISLFFISGIYFVRFSHNAMKWLPKTIPLLKHTQIVDESLKGSLSMEVIIDTGKENGLNSSDFMTRLSQAGDHIEKMKYEHFKIGKTISVADIIKEINQRLHEDKKEFYKIPDKDDLIAQELLLFENSGSDDLKKLVDSSYSKARLTIRAPFKDAVLFYDMIKKIKRYLNLMFPEFQIILTGSITLFVNIITLTIYSFIQSYVIVIIVVTLLMILMIGKAKIGLISMLPNLFPVIVVLGIMGWFQIPIDFSTATIGSIVIGIAVDDTIHFFHNYRTFYEETGNSSKAIFNTFMTTGRAMITTTIVLSCGFFIFMLSPILNLFHYGLLTGTAIISALIGDFFMAPALLTLIHNKKNKKLRYRR